MPELAEVSGLTARLSPHLLHKPILASTATFHANVYVSLTADTLSSFLKGKTTSAIKQWGKYFWLEFEGTREVLLLHLGMNGWVDVRGEDRKAPEGHFATAKTEEGRKEEGKGKGEGVWPPKFTLFTITTAENELAFTDSRKLGKIRILDVPEGKTPLDLPPLSENGPDVHLAPMPVAKWEEALAKRKTTVKAILMDQSFASGLGNWMCDDVCLAAKIHPLRRAPTLSKEEVGNLVNAIKEICDKSVAVHGQASKFPDNWLFHVRWGRQKENVKLKTGEEVSFADAGRATAYVPSIQGHVEAEEKKRKAAGTPKMGKGKKAKKEESDIDIDQSDFSDSPAPKPKAKAKATPKSTPKKKAVKAETPPSTSIYFPPTTAETAPSKRARKPVLPTPPSPTSSFASSSEPAKPTKKAKKATVDSDDYEEPDDDYSEEVDSDGSDGDVGEGGSSGSDYGGRKKKVKKMKPKVVGTRQSARRRG